MVGPLPALCDDMYHARNGLGSVQRTCWSVNDLDAFHLSKIKLREIERASRLINLHTPSSNTNT